MFDHRRPSESMAVEFLADLMTRKTSSAVKFGMSISVWRVFILLLMLLIFLVGLVKCSVNWRLKRVAHLEWLGGVCVVLISADWIGLLDP